MTPISTAVLRMLALAKAEGLTQAQMAELPGAPSIQSIKRFSASGLLDSEELLVDAGGADVLRAVMLSSATSTAQRVAAAGKLASIESIERTALRTTATGVTNISLGGLNGCVNCPCPECRKFQPDYSPTAPPPDCAHPLLHGNLTSGDLTKHDCGCLTVPAA